MKPSGIVSLGLLGLPLAFAALPVYVHVPALYANGNGLTLASLGAVLLVARLLDAGIDPWLGVLADRMSRRRLLGWALWPLALGFAALMNPPASPPLWWLMASLLLTYLGHSAASIAHLAWSAALAVPEGQSSRVTATREGFGLLGVLLAATVPTFWLDAPRDGMVVLTALLPVFLAVGWWGVWFASRRASPAEQAPCNARRIEPPGTVAESPGAAIPLSRVLADPVLQRLWFVFLLNGIASAVPATLFLFFVADVLQAPRSGGPLLALYFLSGALSLPLWVHAAAKLGRPRAWALSMVVALLAFGGAGTLGAGDTVAFGVVCALSGLALGADLSLPAAMAADRGERLGRSGATFGVWNFITKLNLALAAGVALPALGWAGYQPGDSQGLAALSLAYAGLPLIFKALALALLWRWRFILENRS